MTLRLPLSSFHASARRLAAGLLASAAAALTAGPALAGFEGRIIGGSTASFSSNIAGQSQFDNHRFAFDDRTVDAGLVLDSRASAGGDFNFANNYDTRCVRNDGVTPCNGREGPGDSFLLYTTPADYIRRPVGPSTAEARAMVDNGVIRASARASDLGGSVTDITPMPTAMDRLYARPIDITGASAQMSVDLVSSRRVGGSLLPGQVGLATFSGYVEGAIVGNGRVQDNPVDPSASFSLGRAGATFSLSVTDFRDGVPCSGNACPAVNVLATFGDDSPVGDPRHTNGSYFVPFSVVVHTAPGFLLQTRMSLSVYAYGDSQASFGHTARIETIELSDGLTLDTRDGQLLRNGNVYSLVPTLAVPEPATAVLALLGTLVLGRRVRRLSQRPPQPA